MEILHGDVHQYQSDAEKYVGKCFTKELRRLMETNLKLHKELGKLELVGREDLLNLRNKLILQNENIWLATCRRAHENFCDNCEVKIM